MVRFMLFILYNYSLDFSLGGLLELLHLYISNDFPILIHKKCVSVGQIHLSIFPRKTLKVWKILRLFCFCYKVTA